ncbi:MAG: imidazole glycerol phosphate synthase subunit HisF [Deltaproteobacteria bacterium]|nr:imidazole glycerol phosphate synthase subunit HisF [Deltaproteobacteria bacterium]MBI3295906.1 imidazole glycerol phosphate synthase subunit HisF [Deltaproteobacteria bacterium]
MSMRLISRLDIKGPNLIKGIGLEGLRVIGDPQTFAKKYYDSGIDELVFMDIVASLYGRNNIFPIIRRAAQDVFIPITVGGGIRSLDDVREALQSGADKIAINTAAVRRPDLIKEVSRKYGSQCMVLSIEAKRKGPGGWEAYIDNGREHTGLDVVEWAKRGADLGAGEILLTSVDQEGSRNGFDLELITAVAKQVSIPVIASGGMGTAAHLVEAVRSGADAVAMADILHYGRMNVPEIRQYARAEGAPVGER